MDERAPLLKNTSPTPESTNINWTNQSTPPEDHQYTTYGRRWYLLALYTAIAGTQVLIWNTWGSIADTAKPVLGWNDGDIALLTIWGPISMCVTIILFSWLLDVKGLKIAMLCSSTLMLLGAAVRCIPVPIEYMKWTMNIGQLFNGLGGPALIAGPPLFSVTWFPPHQRTTSTGVLTSIGSLGLAASFLIGPSIVSEFKCTNSTSLHPANGTYVVKSLREEEHLNVTSTIKSKHIQEIYLLMYIECGWVACLCLLTWLYFPAKPPTPPSASAETKREDFIPGAKILAVNKQFWIPTETAGRIGAYSALAGAAGGLIFSRIVDIIGGKMKLVLLCVSTASVCCFTWFLLLTLGVIRFNLASLYASIILFAFLIKGTPPIYCELIVEGVYPVSEGIATGSLMWFRAFTALIFLLVMMIPNIGVMWTNWAILGAITFCVPVLLIYKEKYNRLLLDTSGTCNINENTSNEI
ncbi:solute carrier family 49 member 4 homolog [Amphiura filiformis]|uniref:solute carrier family 49 member 4 homolog n=1 Tax=Amphiura filiformis TaxID=82378 RepID=UPI003B21A3A7